MRAMRAPSIRVSAKRTPEPLSVGADLGATCAPLLQPCAASPPPICGRGSRVVGEGQLERRGPRPRRPGARSQRRSSGLAQSRRLSKRPARRCGSRRRRRAARSRWLGRSRTPRTPPPPVPSRCSNPSCRALHQRLPRTSTIPVPGGATQRQRAKRVPATVPPPGRVRLPRWTPSKGSLPSGGDAVGVGAEPAGPGALIPVRVGADPPAALGDRVASRRGPPRRPAAAPRRPIAPRREPAAAPAASAWSLLPRSCASPQPRAGGGEVSPF